MLTYKRKLILSGDQQSRIEKWIGACRVVYNLGLEIRMEAWKNKQQTVHKFELMGQLTDIKDIDWIADVPAQSLQSVIERLDNSYKIFFKGGGFPKWATKRKYCSIKFKQMWGGLKVENNKVYIQKIGWLKIFKNTEIFGNIKTATIKKEQTGYFISIVTDATKNIQNKDENQVIGLDMGLSHFCVDSKGNFITNPKHFEKYEAKLRIENRSLARKKKGSNSWKRQCKKLALLHHKISNVRKDFLHKESTKIAKQYHTVYMEDLNVRGMVRNPKLAKHILDAGWGMFGTMVAYKTNRVGVNPKHTSQQCYVCGHIAKENRKTQSEFECVKCGNIDNADVNAGKNIEGKGITENRQRKALACA